MLKGFSTCQNGFTLIEVVVGFILIGILSAIAVIRGMDSASSAELASEVEVLKSHIRYAQARAMNTNKVWGVSLASTSYAVFVVDEEKQYVTVPGEENATITLPSGCSVDGTEISFDQWGSPYNNDTATGVSSTIELNFSCNDTSKSFSILQNTGFIP